MTIDNIVQITISRETTQVSRAGFGYMLMLDLNTVLHERVTWYTATADMLTDGFLSTDAAYLAAVDHFAQNPKPTQFAVGKIQYNRVTVTIDSVVNLTSYTIIVNGTSYTYVSDASATQTEIANGLVALINAGAHPVTASNVADDVQIDADPSGSIFSVLRPAAQSALLTVGAPASVETVTDALNAIVLVDNTWYGLMLTDRTKSNVLLAAAWVESNDKLAIFASKDTEILSAADVTSIAYTFKQNNYDRSAALYHSKADTEYADAAWFGKAFPYDAGTITWKFKTLSSVTVDTLTQTQYLGATGKDANVYQDVGGNSITQEGTCGSGEFIDVIRGIDWIRSEMQADVYALLLNQPKVPYTNKGISAVKAEVRKVLEHAVGLGILASITSVTAPDVADVLPADKAARILRDVEFEAILAGAIHKVIIQGVITV